MTNIILQHKKTIQQLATLHSHNNNKTKTTKTQPTTTSNNIHKKDFQIKIIQHQNLYPNRFLVPNQQSDE